MTLLTPLGLLGLLGIVVLIIIYIIRPNYQQKFISSTFVWKLSLKYRKKKLPTSKLRNILLIICQVLILTACAAILAQPVQVLKQQVKEAEIIAIIDSSASMRTELDGETRFERAVDGAKTFTEEVLNQNGIVSVILADAEPNFLAQRVTVENKGTVQDVLTDLLYGEYGDTVCSYGSANMESAMTLCAEIIDENPNAQIYLYTDTTYSYLPAQIHLIDVSEPEEWNAAIVNAYTEFDENYYSFIVEVACYGRNYDLELNVTVQNANAMDSNDVGSDVTFSESIFCSDDEVTKVVFISEDLYQPSEKEEENVVYVMIPTSDKIFAYQSVHISLDEDDSFYDDNNFNIYNGQKEVVKIQYASARPNIFFPAALAELKSRFAANWDIQITQVRKDAVGATEGFDFYIYEHRMPEEMPTDGVVFLVNPDNAMFGNEATPPKDSGISVRNIYTVNGGGYLFEDQPEHPLLQNFVADDIYVTRFAELSYDGDYEVLLSYGQYPMLLLKDTPESKVLVMPFSVNFSNLVMQPSFMYFMLNTYRYFFPSTATSSSFEVGEDIVLNARGSELNVLLDGQSEDEAEVFSEFPATYKVDLPGTYVMTQTTFAGKDVKEQIYVRIPALESNINYVADTLTSPYSEIDPTDYYNDLLLYIAAVLVALLFVEWWLQSRENM